MATIEQIEGIIRNELLNARLGQPLDVTAFYDPMNLAITVRVQAGGIHVLERMPYEITSMRAAAATSAIERVVELLISKYRDTLHRSEMTTQERMYTPSQLSQRAYIDAQSAANQQIYEDQLRSYADHTRRAAFLNDRVYTVSSPNPVFSASDMERAYDSVSRRVVETPRHPEPVQSAAEILAKTPEPPVKVVCSKPGLTEEDVEMLLDLWKRPWDK